MERNYVKLVNCSKVSLFSTLFSSTQGPLEKQASTNMFAELQRRNYTIHCSFQMNTRGSKTKTTCIPFQNKLGLRGRLSNKDLFYELWLHSAYYFYYY